MFSHFVPPTVMSIKKESKPNLSHSQVTEITARLFGLTVSTIRPLPSYDDQNFHMVCVDAGDFVLKIMNSSVSENLKLLEMQTHSMIFLQQNGIPVQTALSTITGQMMSLEEIGMNCTHLLTSRFCPHSKITLCFPLLLSLYCHRFLFSFPNTVCWLVWRCVKSLPLTISIIIVTLSYATLYTLNPTT